MIFLLQLVNVADFSNTKLFLQQPNLIRAYIVFTDCLISASVSMCNEPVILLSPTVCLRCWCKGHTGLIEYGLAHVLLPSDL